MNDGHINENCLEDDPIELYTSIDLYHENNNAASVPVVWFTLTDLRTHNEKIARAALETGFAQGYSREGFGSKQEYEEYVEMKLSDFLQSSEYKELVGEEWNQK